MTLFAQDTLMHKEAREAGAVVAHQYAANLPIIEKLITELRASPPHAIVTCARGSSDHAATYAKYMFETQVGLLTSSAAPSVRSVYGSTLKLNNTLFVAISQSGASPDLVATAQAAKDAGALVVAFVNVSDSPLAALADYFIPLHAGPENSVAATKTYIATLAAILQFTAHWSRSAPLLSAVDNLSTDLLQAADLDWSAATKILSNARNFFVIGRGTSFGIAQEAALKFKETSGLHAEAYSAAEVKHGPMAIVGQDFPILVFRQEDQTAESIDSVVEDFIGRGARVMVAGKDFDGAVNLPYIVDRHPAVAPILLVQSFYIMVNALSVMRGYNPDKPPHLNKVTETV
ncbi:glucosamine-fructose-6-phosphate aminotransferase [Kordiimonas sediminis]|uniref:Glucosamine-fructose-6-phosphate aminotransferase n=1 Tax=Kordiimonas sediminis TaxID=1735581 RepID=A0A919AM28_9PROT|nr:SIS domain-containing protein [Kordiimonas sediminis]GHF13749.1 glucosamine-fructose-6-phosphate aminotransferase [Kordiimonas sediminis]